MELNSHKIHRAKIVAIYKLDTPNDFQVLHMILPDKVALTKYSN